MKHYCIHSDYAKYFSYMFYNLYDNTINKVQSILIL